MNTKFTTDQEVFWAGEFGEDYISRNTAGKYLASNIHLFAKILARSGVPESLIELGANVGLNLEAIRAIAPTTELSAVEINATACGILQSRMPDVNLTQGSILNHKTHSQYDMVLVKGVLIHLNPEKLADVYDTIAALSLRYVVIAEYYNPEPVALPYRGNSEKLFKRDFAGEFMDRHSEYSLVDYGFCWRRDPAFPQDDITWFLLQNNSA